MLSEGCGIVGTPEAAIRPPSGRISEDTPDGTGGQDSRGPGVVAPSGPVDLQPRPRRRWPPPVRSPPVVQRPGGTGCIQPLTSPAGEPSDGGLPAVNLFGNAEEG